MPLHAHVQTRRGVGGISERQLAAAHAARAIAPQLYTGTGRDPNHGHSPPEWARKCPPR